jgi:hypothetical protein
LKLFLFLETLLDAHSAALLAHLDATTLDLLLRALHRGLSNRSIVVCWLDVIVHDNRVGFEHTSELVVVCAFESVEALRNSDRLDVQAEAQLLAAVLVALIGGAVRSPATVATASR